MDSLKLTKIQIRTCFFPRDINISFTKQVYNHYGIYFVKLDCPICKDELVDPRVLPCGHSYCPLPRPCLTFLEKEPGLLSCATCRAQHRISIVNLKPLYGIREVLMSKSDERKKLQEELTKLKLCGVCERDTGDNHNDSSSWKIIKYLANIVGIKIPTQESYIPLDNCQKVMFLFPKFFFMDWYETWSMDGLKIDDNNFLQAGCRVIKSSGRHETVEILFRTTEKLYTEKLRIVLELINHSNEPLSKLKGLFSSFTLPPKITI